VSSSTERAIALATLEERLRQERETFDQMKENDRRATRLRITMGWIACVMLPVIASACLFILYNHDLFTDATVTTVGIALLVDVTGMVLGIWRVFAGSPQETLAPVTPRE